MARRKSFIDQLSYEELKEARRLEAAGFSTFSGAAKAIVHKNEGYPAALNEIYAREAAAKAEAAAAEEVEAVEAVEEVEEVEEAEEAEEAKISETTQKFIDQHTESIDWVVDGLDPADYADIDIEEWVVDILSELGDQAATMNNDNHEAAVSHALKSEDYFTRKLQAWVNGE